MTDELAMAASPYEMAIDLNVLNHLGIHLYSNVAAILSEAVANAWDADATRVDIDIDAEARVITIRDNGAGMSRDDVNNRFLRIGYAKRQTEGDTSNGGRQFMGRKGIGKLSLFSVADTICVRTSKGGPTSAFCLNLGEIRSAIAAGASYRPQVVPEGDEELDHGTELRLTDLKTARLGVTASALRRRLARRFAVIGRAFTVERDGGTTEDEFRVFINGDQVTDEDREDVGRLQFLWGVGDGPRFDVTAAPELAKKGLLDGVISDEKSWVVRGWLGAVSKPKRLVTDDGGNMNTVVVLARGRLIQENILDKINDGRLVTKYLTGQLEADFLDISATEDIATTDRQRVIEDDERYVALEQFVRRCLNTVAENWTEWRNEIGAAEAQEEFPILQDWIGSLRSDAAKRSARTVIGHLQALPIDKEEDRKLLYRHGIYAFERMALRDELERFADALGKGVDVLLPLFGQVDDIEAALYLDIVRGRVQVIRAFNGLVDANEKERVLQQHLFDHLWLLDPSWERATASELMEQRVATAFEGIDAGLTAEELNGRVDIKYRTTAGKHVIIELKRADRELSVTELVGQGRKYREATRKCLEAIGKGSEPVEVVFVVGRPVAEAQDNEFVGKQLESIHARIVTYDQLIDSALRGYGEYLEKAEALSRIDDIINGL